MFRFNKTNIREPTVCASLKLQYGRQLKYFVIGVFGRVAAYASTRPNSSGNWYRLARKKIDQQIVQGSEC